MVARSKITVELLECKSAVRSQPRMFYLPVDSSRGIHKDSYFGALGASYETTRSGASGRRVSSSISSCMGRYSSLKVFMKRLLYASTCGA